MIARGVYGASIGASLAGGYRNLAGYWAFLAYTIMHLRVLSIAPVRTIFRRQIYFSGIESLKLVVTVGLLAGAAVATEATALLGADELSVKGLVWVLVGELGPLLAAIIIIARSSVAIAAELSLMHIRDETTHLAMMHIPPLDYLVVPRIAALTVSAVVLTVYFQAVAVLGGIAVSAIFQNVSFAAQVGRFLQLITTADLAVAGVKSLCFGVAIATISCFHGLDVGKSMTAIPVAATRAVVQSLLFVLVLDAAFGWARYAAF
jgi:phospholipid/cholesterol/gamma-HCH transport system permease protein